MTTCLEFLKVWLRYVFRTIRLKPVSFLGTPFIPFIWHDWSSSFTYHFSLFYGKSVNQPTNSCHLNNFFNFHVRLSMVPFVQFRPCVRKLTSIPASVLQNVTNKSCLVYVKSKIYASWVTLRPQWDCCCLDEAEVCILDFKTTWSVFQIPSQTAPAEAKPRCVYSILKPHGQSSITSPELVQSSCVH